MYSYPTIDKVKTGRRIKALMKKRGLNVKNVKEYLGLGSVQSVYHWLDGSSMPTIDNLYALSELLQVPIDDMLCGNRELMGRGILLKEYSVIIRSWWRGFRAEWFSCIYTD